MAKNEGLPKDLKDYARAAFWRKSRAFIISFAITALALVFFGDVILPSKYPEVKPIVYTFILALPFIFTKFPFCVIDSTYCGIVEDIEVKMTKEARPAPYSYKGHYIYDKGIVYLKIRTPDGRLIKRKVYGGIASLQKYINKFQKDDEVFHLYGTDTVVVLRGEAGTHIQCPVCGEINEKENELCRECGHTLVRDLAFAWEGAAVPQKKTQREGFDLPPDKRDAYVEEKKRVYDDFVEGGKKPHRAEEKKTAGAAESAPYTPNATAEPQSYAEARKSAILARQIREEREETAKKQEIAHYADYDDKIIKQTKEEEAKKAKHSFFREFFSYFGTAVLISYASSYIILPLLGSTFLLAETNFFVETLLFSIILFVRYFSFGKNEFVHKRVSRKKIFLSAIPAWAIFALAYAVFHGSTVFVPDKMYGNHLSGDGIYSLALMFCGLGRRYIGEQPIRFDVAHGWIRPGAPLPQYFPLAFIISFVLNAAYYTWLMWIAYKFGIDERDEERRDIMEGTDTVEKRRKRRTFAKCFIPFVNYYPIYSWSYDYWVNPEPDRKLKYFFRGVAAMLAGMTVIEILRYIFFQFCKSAFLNGVVFYLSLHLVGCVISLVAYYDDKRHEKLMERYKD